VAAEDEAVAAPATDAIGARLQQARERQGLSREKCAERLCLETRVIEALETEQFQLLGAGVYARGHLRRYAELLGEDPREYEQLLARRAGTGGAPDLTRIVTQSMTQPVQGRKIGVWPAAIVTALLVLAAVIRWAMSTHGTVATSEVTTVVAPTPVITVPASSTEPPAATAIKTVAPAAAPAKPAAVSAPVAVAPSARMTVSFLGDGWFEVADATGKRLYADQGRAGSVVSLQGTPPLRLVVGNIKGVAMDLNGRRVRLPESFPAADRLQLRLDANGQASLE
jgi:cytoskeleton protein RodZ